MGVDGPTGCVIGGFRVGDLVARGAMGAVYIAEDAKGERVALKLLSPELAHDERFRQRFLRESRLAAALDHPKVVKTIASGRDGGVLYLAMAYVDGVDLRELLRREGKLEPERVVGLVRQVAEALDAAHAGGLIHRDVKPGNVLVASGPEGEQAYVCDFGLARHVSSVGSLTGDRGFVGTVDYVAPEQIRGAAVDGRADVYALGCVLFECLAGERPFERESELAVVFAHLNEPPPRLTELQLELPAAWDSVVARALAKEPDARYPTCGALAVAATHALRGRAAPSRRSRWPMAAAAAALAVAAAAIGTVLAVRGGSPTAKLAAEPPLVLDAVDATSGRALATLRSGARFGYANAPTDVVLAGRSAWLLLPSEQRLLRVDARTRELTAAFSLPWVPLGRLAAGDGYVWAAQDGGPELARVSTATGRLDRFRPVASPSEGLTAGGGSLWVATQQQLIAKVVPANGSTGRNIPYDGTGRITFGDGAIWSLEHQGILRKLDPGTGRVLAQRDLHVTVSDVAVGGGLVWVSVVPDGFVYGLDERDLRVRRKLAASSDPERLSFAGGRLWVANTAAGAVTSLDPRSGTRRRLLLEGKPAAAAYGNGIVWTGTVPEPPPLPAASGPELRLSLAGDYLTLDPALSHSTHDEQLETATCANLLAYPDTNGLAGKRLRPEVAAAMPQVSPDGRTYTFRIRSGFRFSPPSNEPVTAATFKHTLERVVSPRLGNGGRGPSEAPAIVGLAAFRAGKAAHVAGIKVRGDTLSITLVKPSGDFLGRISLPHLCPVPLRTPMSPTPPDRALPSTGPYYVSSTANGRIVLLPNPRYGGDRPRRWARIVYTLDVPTSQAVTLVDRGSLDYLPIEFDSEGLLRRWGVLDRRYGTKSRAARRGAQRYFPTTGRFVDYIVLNANRPLFRDARLRRAVNYVLDRPALAAVFHDSPGDQIVPPSVEGFPSGAFYPIDGPDLVTARRLAGDLHRHAILSYCTFFPFGDDGLRPVAPIVKANLARIGIDVSIVRTDECPPDYDASSNRADLLLITNFGSQLSDPMPFLDQALARGPYASALGPGPWTSASFRRRFGAARALRGSARTVAYVRLERELMRAAPFAVYGTFSFGQYVSPRIGCEVTTAANDLLDLLALCPRHA
jgi:ABC-type transport system substrate-binding protein/tRNA A-37 threonylcarbamoyl transferase component Bud32